MVDPKDILKVEGKKVTIDGSKLSAAALISILSETIPQRSVIPNTIRIGLTSSQWKDYQKDPKPFHDVWDAEYYELQSWDEVL